MIAMALTISLAEQLLLMRDQEVKEEAENGDVGI